jgi:K+-sensing histidine kinase KdpD
MIHSVINKILLFSLENRMLKDILQFALDNILLVEELHLKPIGAILIADKKKKELPLFVYRGFTNRMLEECSGVSFWKCVCGRTFLDGKAHFVERYCINGKGSRWPAHSHYCIPIKSSKDIFGVITVYPQDNSRIDLKNNKDLLLFSGVLAKIIIFKQSQMEISKTQEKLYRSKRLSDIGEIAARVAHELRNPLAAIKLALYNIEKKKTDNLIDGHIRTISGKIDESNHIINDLLFYSRIRMPDFKNLNIGDVLDECISIAKNRFKRNDIKIEKKFNRRVSIEADRVQMLELFGNILSNAYESFDKKGGRIQVCSFSDAGFVNLVIQDDGMGIDKKNIAKIGEMFFTTKAKGTGLGLKICYQIVSLHNGSIHIKSKKHKGAQVTVSLPAKQIP